MSALASAGFVLHRRPYREDSALVDIFTLEQGRTRVVAHGLNRKRRPLAPLLQPFQLLMLSWRAKGELGSLRHVELEHSAISLKGEALFASYYLNELLLRILPADTPEPTLFDHYHQLLNALALDAPLEPQLRDFELNLLAVLGYGMSAYDQQGEALEQTRYYHWQSQAGWVEQPASERTVPGWAIYAIIERQWQQPEVLAYAKQLCRQWLMPLLGDAPLRSRQLWLQMKARMK